MASRRKIHSRKRKTCRRKRSHKRGSSSRRRIRRGGNPAGSAAAYGEAVYGNAGSQHAMDGTNQIAENYVLNN